MAGNTLVPKLPNIKVPTGTTSTKALAIPKAPVFKMPNITQPKVPKQPNLTQFNFAKFTKPPKLPKEPKIAILHKAIKKNAGF